MQYLRIYAGPDGESHFEDVDVAMTPNGVAHTSDVVTAKGVIFHRSPGSRVHDWHNAPRRQFVVHLTGEVEVETSDGEKRQVPPGSVVLAEDTTGKGHITRNISPGERLTLFIPLPD